MHRERKNPRNIAVTGASSGLGRALAMHYAKEGARLFLTGRNMARLQETRLACEQAASDVHVSALDLREPAPVKKWIDEIERQSPIDVLIANAGVTGTHERNGAIETAETAQLQIATNLGGAVNLVTSAAPHMQARGCGTIVLVSSLAGLQPIADGPAYGASKAGIIAYGEAMRQYLADYGVFLSVVCPGYIKTPMADQYKSWRPLELTAERAAEKIARAADRRRALYAFPFALALSIRLGLLLPWQLRKNASRKFNYIRD
ncbi:SDR family NAD(P)-dependent oxidoreductase [Pseudovibrio exalbescens]|uniref:Short-chain dehydrogenase n=1 Tax=Pseudovibrio exalbescens TaxID=197461 RepID=A0A1U7JM35_9HYPH|nr:SDR family NAD(P)-dependent oxidoreductase [Pseudovibrio exalbescens]OKL45775.1 short-chain dehydrogenase [Pseudovibrio exalbescens]